VKQLSSETVKKHLYITASLKCITEEHHRITHHRITEKNHPITASPSNRITV